jgi:hypothetical protein
MDEFECKVCYTFYRSTVRTISCPQCSKHVCTSCFQEICKHGPAKCPYCRQHYYEEEQQEGDRVSYISDDDSSYISNDDFDSDYENTLNDGDRYADDDFAGFFMTNMWSERGADADGGSSFL